jgi:hypothetical protein
MLNKIYFLFSLIIQPLFVSASETCGPSQIEYIEDQKKVAVYTELCVSKDERGQLFYSKNCAQMNCSILKKESLKFISLEEYEPSIGSPGFKVCRELGGLPQIIDYNFKDQWHQGSRCIFDKDTFVSNDLLIKLWKDFIIGL